MDPELLKILACPVCKTPVEYHEAESVLACAKCRRRYAVKDDIPNMLPEEASRESPPRGDEHRGG
ncbi:MAG: Trm112 family protein [Elusimicrobia bacterium]|nr:Trm112 family protein [Elusimicrobiota bacterium]